MIPTIVPVQSRADLNTFVALPRQIYGGMEGFVAPLDYERRQMLDPKKAPFYTHGEGAYWLARQNGRTVGRISAQIDQLATAPECANAGFFGCLDAIDDPAVVQALMITAEAWIQSRGRTAAQGPYLLSINGKSGLLVEGHDVPPMTMMPWHPRYLAGLLEGAGYRTVQTLLAFSLPTAAFDAPAWERMVRRKPRSADLRVRGLRMRALDAEMEIMRGLFNDAWSRNWGFAPLDPVEMKALRAGFRPFLFADSAIVVERSGEPAGFMLLLPNIFEIIADLGGTLGVLGWPRFLLRVLRKPYRSVRVILMGIARKYQETPIGSEIAIEMVLELARRRTKHDVTSIEAGWILENNVGMIRILQAVGFRRCRSYGIFEKALGPAKSAGQGV